MESDQHQLRNKSQFNPPLLVTCRVDELSAHPAYLRHRLGVSAAQLATAAARSDVVFQEPLVITRNRTIVEGYDQWQLARHQGQKTLPCIEYDMTEDEALHRLLQRHRGSKGLNAFSRILLALDLEPWLKEKARSNQSAGGQNKGSSNLTEAERLDVRSEIASAAGVSVGNVTKVRQVITTTCLELQDALRSGEVSIHRAWLWREVSPANQRRALLLHRGEKGVKKTIRRLISKHRRKNPASAEKLGLTGLIQRLSQIQSHHIGSVEVAAVDVPGKGVFVTEELLRLLPAQEELPILCIAESHSSRF